MFDAIQVRFWSAGLSIRPERGGRFPHSGRCAGSHASAEEEEETAPLVGSLPQNPAEEGRVVEPRAQFHSVRSPRTAVRFQLSLRHGAKLL